MAQFPPQRCGPAPPPKVGVAGGAARVHVNDLGGGVEGCCRAHNIIDPQCPRQVRRLLELMLGDGEGVVVGEAVRCGVGARGQGGELHTGWRDSLLEHGQKKMRTKALRAVRKQNSGNEGKFVRNSYQIRTNFVRIRTKFVRISHSRESVNLA